MSHRLRKVSTPLISIMLLALFVWSCSTVPITGRSQLALLPDGELAQMSLTEYDKVLKESTVLDSGAELDQVRRVGKRIAKATEDYLTETGQAARVAEFQWDFNVIKDDKTANAWCMPGGKIAVYTGLLPVTKDDTGLAVVMGHEVAHALARHGNERMSEQMVAKLGSMSLSLALRNQPDTTQSLYMTAFGVGANVFGLLPFSRTHETEADKIGLVLMAKAGYDPRQAVPFWQRMAEAGGGGGGVEFLSTHPTEAKRIRDIEAFMPTALEYYKK